MYRCFIKRFLDFSITLIGLICISPLLLFLCLLVKFKLGSPIFFTQVRIGKDEKPFRMIKFRTMLNTRDANGHLLPDTDRFSDFGNFLRRTSLDELPELFNVFKGEMSLVGPRPLYPLYLPYYLVSENLRHTVRAGITGFAQINGRAMCKWDERFAMDCEYVKNLSLWNDIKILYRTFLKVASQDDASIPSVNEEEGLHILRDVQQPEKIELVNEINKKYGQKQMPTFVHNNKI